MNKQVKVCQNLGTVTVVTVSLTRRPCLYTAWTHVLLEPFHRGPVAHTFSYFCRNRLRRIWMQQNHSHPNTILSKLKKEAFCYICIALSSFTGNNQNVPAAALCTPSTRVSPHPRSTKRCPAGGLGVSGAARTHKARRGEKEDRSALLSFLRRVALWRRSVHRLRAATVPSAWLPTAHEEDRRDLKAHVQMQVLPTSCLMHKVILPLLAG